MHKIFAAAAQERTGIISHVRATDSTPDSAREYRLHVRPGISVCTTHARRCPGRAWSLQFLYLIMSRHETSELRDGLGRPALYRNEGICLRDQLASWSKGSTCCHCCLLPLLPVTDDGGWAAGGRLGQSRTRQNFKLLAIAWTNMRSSSGSHVPVTWIHCKLPRHLIWGRDLLHPYQDSTGVEGTVHDLQQPSGEAVHPADPSRIQVW